MCGVVVVVVGCLVLVGWGWLVGCSGRLRALGALRPGVAEFAEESAPAGQVRGTAAEGNGRAGQGDTTSNASRCAKVRWFNAMVWVCFLAEPAVLCLRWFIPRHCNDSFAI